MIAAPEGVKKICTEFPRIKVITSEVDEKVDEQFRVVPGNALHTPAEHDMLP